MTPDEDKMKQWILDELVHFGPDENSVPCIKSYLTDREFQAPYSVFYQDGRAATKRLRHVLGSDDFGYPKDETVVGEAIAMLCGPNESALDYFAGSGTTGHAVIALNREDKGNRRYSLVEMGGHFDSTLLPRLKKVVYSTNWKDGTPTSRDTGISHCFKYIRLESYEDTLNNLTFKEDAKRTETLSRSPSLKEDYMLRYLLDVETRGSQSLLNIDAFADPTAYQLTVKKPGSDEQETRHVDLIETFNYLIGLRVTHYAAPQNFSASFKREPDPELPEDQHTKLIVDGAIKQDTEGSWWFRKVEGWVPKNPSVPDHETREKNPQNMERILIVWRKLTGDLEQDNLMLDVWFRKHGISTQDYEYDTIYVNGSNNLPNLKQDDEHWKVRLIEEEFMKRMWDTSDA
jgi:adenine-specific DNA-methyltransferase